MPRDFPANNPNVPAQQNASPSVDDSKTPAVITPKKADSAQPTTPTTTKSKTAAKRKSRRHHRGTR